MSPYFHISNTIVETDGCTFNLNKVIHCRQGYKLNAERLFFMKQCNPSALQIQIKPLGNKGTLETYLFKNDIALQVNGHKWSIEESSKNIELNICRTYKKCSFYHFKANFLVSSSANGGVY